MVRKKRTQPTDEFADAIYINDQTFLDYQERFKKIAMSIFEWKNLPNSMDGRFIERCLYYLGMCAFLKDENYGFINVKATPGGDFNIYGLPTTINCYSYGYHATRRMYSGLNPENNDEFSECIFVMNNWEYIPTSATLSLFAWRLYEAQRTCDINIASQRTPILITIDPDQKFTLKNIYERYEGNTPVIFADKNQLNPDMLRALKTDAPYVADKITDYKKEIWNEALTFLGINNLSEKRERLISDETNTNNELINLNLMSFLAPRKEACRLFNEKYGLTGDKAIDVEVRSDLDNLIKRTASVVVDDYADKAIELETKKELGVKDNGEI